MKAALSNPMTPYTLSSFILALLAFGAVPMRVQAQAINVTSTGVGIGSASPTAKLEINLSNSAGWNGNTKALRVFSPDLNYFLDLNTIILGAGNTGYQFSPNGNTGLTISTPGNIGIGTTTPTSKLSISGGCVDINVANNNGTEALDWPNVGLSIRRQDDYIQMKMLQFGHVGDSAYQTNDAVWGFSLLDNVGGKTLSDNNTSLLNQGPGNLLFVIRGNVGIGILAPTQKLEVAGNVKATSFISATKTYADSVFSKDYKLSTLSEVEMHIAKEGHLPGIPSEAEARANGIDIGDMQVRLLGKIEELTLHMIQQEKIIKAQGELLKQLQEKTARPETVDP